MVILDNNRLVGQGARDYKKCNSWHKLIELRIDAKLISSLSWAWPSSAPACHKLFLLMFPFYQTLWFFFQQQVQWELRKCQLLPTSCAVSVVPSLTIGRIWWHTSNQHIGDYELISAHQHANWCRFVAKIVIENCIYIMPSIQSSIIYYIIIMDLYLYHLQ